MQGHADRPNLNRSILINGTAKEPRAGPAIGLLDIGVSDSAYIFRVVLSGVRKDQNNLKCEIQRDGRVQVHGVITDGEVVREASNVYQMNVQQLCQPGPFTISFNLPGPVDPRLFIPTFRADGVLEGVILRHYKSSSSSNGQC